MGNLGQLDVNIKIDQTTILILIGGIFLAVLIAVIIAKKV
jgi:hypothetical protein